VKTFTRLIRSIVILISVIVIIVISTFSHQRVCIIHIVISKAPIANIALIECRLAAFSGWLLARVPLADTLATAVQLEPHAYPVGQHPPPTVSAQLNQPLAHRPVPLAAVVVWAGTTMVRPSDVMVDDALTGQDVVSQSRPVRQQPPS
jgi:hypothetical protein